MKNTQFKSLLFRQQAHLSFSQNRMLKICLNFSLLIGFLLLGNGLIMAQSNGDYRSRQDGLWSNPGTWERYNGGNETWSVPNSGSPGRTDNTTIISGHTITVAENKIVGSVTIETGAQVTVNSGVTFSIADQNTGDDVTVNGTLDIFGTVNFSSQGGGSSSSSQVGVSGTVINNNGAVLNANIDWTFYDGSTYRHARNGASVPLATWTSTSTCLLSGITGNLPGNLDQMFGNFVWNSSGMIEQLTLGTGPTEVTGNFEVQNTGSQILNFSQDQLLIGGDFGIGTNASFRMTGGTNSTVFNVAGGFKMDGGNLTLSAGNGTGTLNVGGDFNQAAGTIAQSGEGQANINFSGTDPDNIPLFTGTGTFSGLINFNVLSGAYLSLGIGADLLDLSGSTGTFSNFGTLMGDFLEDMADEDDEGVILPSGKPLDNQGILAPGNSVGTLVIIGDLISSGTLSAEVESNTVYDKIIVTGNAAITGDIEVEFISYTPAVNDDFFLVAANTYIGSAHSGLTIIPATTSGTYDDASGILNIDAVLPIHLLSFTGERVSEGIQLHWRTATEQNNDYMAIERAGPDFQFTEIGRVSGVGTTTEPQDYDFLDEAPLAGVNYYRLRQVDIDGTMEYHPVIPVDFVEPSRADALRAFPNPASEYIRAAWQAGNDQPATLRLFTTSGQLLQTCRVNGQNGTHELPVEGLAPGIYHLQLEQGGQFEHFRFVKK